MKHVSRRCWWLVLIRFSSYRFSPANFTRFYVLARAIDGQLPSTSNPRNPYLHPGSQNKGLLRIREPPSSGPTHSRPQPSNRMCGGGLASLLSVLDLQICRLDRRPLLGAKTFEYVYIVEVGDGDQASESTNTSLIVSDSVLVAEAIEGSDGDASDLRSNRPLVRFEADGGWVSRLRAAAERVVGAGGDAEVLGCW